MYKTIFFIIILILINCSSEKALIESPLSLSEMKRLQGANKTEDIFYKESEIQLSSSEESIIASITDMEIDGKGNFIIADGWKSRAVFVFAPDGKFIKQLGQRGQGPGEYSTPVSIAISNKHEIWIADYSSNRINIYNRNYDFKEFIICKPRIRHFIHLNSHDEIYMYSGAVNPFRRKIYNSIRKYNIHGNEMVSFAQLPEEVLDVKFMAIQNGMTIDKDDFIYEMNPLYYNIRKFTPEGNFIKAFTRKTDLFKIITNENETPIIIYGPYYLEKGLIVAQVHEHLEIYDTEGNFIVGELPFSYRIINTYKNRLYVYLWEDGVKPENLPNPKIISFKLKM